MCMCAWLPHVMPCRYFSFNECVFALCCDVCEHCACCTRVPLGPKFVGSHGLSRHKLLTQKRKSAKMLPRNILRLQTSKFRVSQQTPKLSLWLSGSASTRRTPEPPNCLPPPRARPRRKGASRGPSPQPSPPPPHPAGPHRHLRSRPRPTRAASPRSPTPPPPPPTSPPSASWPALPTRTGHGPETNIPAWGRECRPPQG